MKDYKNLVLSGEHSVVAGDIFCVHFCTGVKKLDNMTPESFKTCFEILLKLYDKLKADYELILGEKVKTLKNQHLFC